MNKIKMVAFILMVIAFACIGELIDPISTQEPIRVEPSVKLALRPIKTAVIVEKPPLPSREKEVLTEETEVTEEAHWNQPHTEHLTASGGVYWFGDQKETWYNLPMEGVISIMNSFGYSHEDYWVRWDGVKMLGDYVMIAANLDVHPRGTLVETSLGTGLVCDTGGFAKNNPLQVDIAVSW